MVNWGRRRGEVGLVLQYFGSLEVTSPRGLEGSSGGSTPGRRRGGQGRDYEAKTDVVWGGPAETVTAVTENVLAVPLVISVTPERPRREVKGKWTGGRGVLGARGEAPPSTPTRVMSRTLRGWVLPSLTSTSVPTLHPFPRRRS